MNIHSASAPAMNAEAGGIVAMRIDPRWLLAATVIVVAAQNLLLWRFLDFAPAWLYAAGVAGFGALALLIVKFPPVRKWRGPTIGTLVLLGGGSLAIFLLGGEGRLFYANADWQIRDAVLRDLTLNPWPFVYQQNGTVQLLRAPLGMYLFPAIVGKSFGLAAADFALLVQNSLLLTLLLGMGSTLFARSRGVALAVVIVFSGMDIVGQLLWSAGGAVFPDHIENWAGRQFSSHITQAFWVPQHALAGWFGALLFLLWRERRIALWQMYMLLPMLLLLSPLGVMGTLPFAAYAGLETLATREIRPNDVILPLLATLLCVPAVLYLGAAGGEVGIHFLPVDPITYFSFELVEVVVFVAGVGVVNRGRSGEMRTLLLVTACLAAVPLVQLGEGMDFTMRVSISSLAILSVQVAWTLSRVSVADPDHRSARRMLLVALAIGSVTGLFEIARAVRLEPTPRVRCSLVSAWDQVIDIPRLSTKATYVAPVTALPKVIRPTQLSHLSSRDPICWDRAWKVARFSAL